MRVKRDVGKGQIRGIYFTSLSRHILIKYSKRVQKTACDGAMCVMQNSLMAERCVILKINHKTFLRKRMSIGYLEPLVSDWFRK